MRPQLFRALEIARALGLDQGPEIRPVLVDRRVDEDLDFPAEIEKRPERDWKQRERRRQKRRRR